MNLVQLRLPGITEDGEGEEKRDVLPNEEVCNQGLRFALAEQQWFSP